MDLKAQLIHTNGKTLDMPTYVIQNTYIKPYTGPDTITILTILDEEWTTNDTTYKTKFEDTHISIYFIPYTITYTKPTISLELNKEPCIKSLAIKILHIHYKNIKIDIEDLETKLLQITTNLQISPPYIKTLPPSPKNVKVHKHPKWNKTLHLTHLHQTTPPPIPSFPQFQFQNFPSHKILH